MVAEPLVGLGSWQSTWCSTSLASSLVLLWHLGGGPRLHPLGGLCSSYILDIPIGEFIPGSGVLASCRKIIPQSLLGMATLLASRASPRIADGMRWAWSHLSGTWQQAEYGKDWMVLQSPWWGILLPPTLIVLQAWQSCWRFYGPHPCNNFPSLIASGDWRSGVPFDEVLRKASRSS